MTGTLDTVIFFFFFCLQLISSFSGFEVSVSSNNQHVAMIIEQLKYKCVTAIKILFVP